jgi:hypothetical protein
LSFIFTDAKLSMVDAVHLYFEKDIIGEVLSAPPKYIGKN